MTTRYIAKREDIHGVGIFVIILNLSMK